jgi:hypothetical protein
LAAMEEESTQAGSNRCGRRRATAAAIHGAAGSTLRFPASHATGASR